MRCFPLGQLALPLQACLPSLSRFRTLARLAAQEWDNYKRAVKRNKNLRETFKAIKLRPPFEDEMREAGFQLEQRIEREEGGFSRPLLVWRKIN